MPSEEAGYQRTLVKKLFRGDQHVILIEKAEHRSAVADLQRTTFYTGGPELGCRSVHLFNRLMRCVVGRSS